MNNELKALLDKKHDEYNRPEFIADDPISVPHQFSKKQDIEIVGLWTAILAWGQRKVIIQKSLELFRMMDFSPHDFIMNHGEKDLAPFVDFKHRTFNGDDTLYFIHFFRHFYQTHQTLEEAFLDAGTYEPHSALSRFHHTFFDLDFCPTRTKKHVSTPMKNSACKRINMFLRWMVRNDGKGVDFGLWNNIPASQLVCPCDVHVGRVARKLGLISRPQSDWAAAKELTENLKQFDAKDPVKYDFALFGMGMEGFHNSFVH